MNEKAHACTAQMETSTAEAVLLALSLVYHRFRGLILKE